MSTTRVMSVAAPMTRRAILRAAAAGSVPILAACDASGGSAATKARGPAKVIFWNYGGGGISDQLFEPVAVEYRKQFPQITLERVGIPSAEIQDKMVVAWSSDTAPDIVMDSNRGFLRFMDNGWFLDLS